MAVTLVFTWRGRRVLQGAIVSTSRGFIVIVEDDAGLNQALCRLLQAAGFHVASFESAAAALSSDLPQSADCLVLDVHLLDMTGYELRRLLAARGPSPPTIVITAHDDARTRREAVSIGAVAFLPKPFAGHALIDAVTRIIDSGD